MSAPGGTRPVSSGVLALAVVAALASVLLAVAVVADRGSAAPTRLPAVESHRLDPDQAACLQFGLVMRRSTALRLTVALGRFQGLDPGVVPLLDDEVEALDAIASAHPEADQRLVAAFDEVARQGAAVLAYDDQLGYRTAVTNRSATAATARDECRDIAGFDVEELEVREGGRP
jgi:hypothetical protein